MLLFLFTIPPKKNIKKLGNDKYVLGLHCSKKAKIIYIDLNCPCDLN